MGSFLLRTACALVLLALHARADLLRVSHQGSVEFTTIQAAVLAANEGDVIVVGEGNYAGFWIQGKGVSVVAMLGHRVIVTGPVRVTNVPVGSAVLLADLELAPTYSPPAQSTPTPVLELEGNPGSIRVHGTLIGQEFIPAPCSDVHGVTAARVSASPDVAFFDCTLRGSDGTSNPLSFYWCDGMAGGHGLLVEQGSRVALHDTILRGGLGGHGGIFGGDGGSGARVQGSWLFAAQSSFEGRRGGNAQDSFAHQDGHGGHGLHLDAGSHLVHVECSFLAGAAGYGAGNGLAGQPLAGPGSNDPLGGPTRRLLAPRWAVTGSPLEVLSAGLAGDEVRIARRTRAGFRYWAANGGVWLTTHPAPLPIAPDTVLPAGGAVLHALTTPALPTRAALLHLQSLHTPTAGPAALSGGQVIVVIDPSTVPWQDCNGNGVLDLADILLGNAQDLDRDLVPDGCGVSGDLHVDASAAPGGSGSALTPFQSLGEAFAVAGSDATILVAPGLYTGSENADLDLAGRALTVRGTGPAGSVVIDCGLADRFLVATAPVAGTVRLEQLTVRRARASNQSIPVGHGGALHLVPAPTRLEIVACRFEQCSATGQGGALHLVGGELLLTDSEFDQCTATIGGAIALAGTRLEVRGALFHRNLATDGAALIGTDLARSWLHGVRWLDNTASTGSAVRLSNCATGVLLQACVLAGNSAPLAALRIDNGACGALDARLNGLTVFGNGGPAGARAIQLEGRINAHLRNTILWGQAGGGAGAVRLLSSAGCAHPPLLTVAYCNLEAGAGAIEAPAGSVGSGAQVLALDPVFEDPAGSDGDPATWLDNGLSLALASPLIDAGSNGALLPDVLDLDGNGDTIELAPVDLLGNPRRVDIPQVPDTGHGGPPTVDMGAYERQR